MSRTRTRVSRALIGLLVVTITLGIVSYLHKTRQSRAAEEAALNLAVPSAAAPASPVAPPATPQTIPQPPAPAPILVTRTPVGLAPNEENLTEQESLALTGPTMTPLAPSTPILPPAISTPQPVQHTPSNTGSTSTRPVADGRAKLESGDLLGARQVLNTALISGRLSSNDAREARNMLQAINEEIVLSPRRFPNDEFGGSYNVRSGDLLSRIASNHDVTWELLGRINGISDPRRLRAGQTIKVIQGPFHGVVTKRTFTMDIYLGAPGGPGSVYVMSFPVGLGEHDSTPAGVWMVEPQKKLRNPTYYSPRGAGIIHSGDPNNPLGTHWIGLVGVEGDAVGKTSYGIHGTIEPDSIGRQESMGCIRLLNEDVAIVFDMLVEGKSRVVVRD
jgi:LysM repeat protein